MRISVTLLLIIIFMVVTGIWYFLEQKTVSDRARIFAFDPTVVTKIEIAQVGHTTRLHKKNNKWRIITPFSDDANADLINRLIDFTLGLNLKHNDPIPASPGYGISPQSLTLHFRNEADEPLADLRVGNRHPTENSTYIQKLESPTDEYGNIFLATGDISTLGILTPDQLHNPFLAKINPADTVAFKIQKKSGPIEFIRDKNNGEWSIAQPFAAPADSQKVDEMITKIAGSKVLLFIHNKIKYKDTDSIKLTFTDRDGDETKAIIFNQQDKKNKSSKLLARISGRPLTLQVDPELLDQISFFALAKSNLKFFSGDFSSFDSILISKDRDQSVSMQRENGIWQMTQNGRLMLADAEKIDRFIHTLGKFRAWHKISPTPANIAPYGLDQPHYNLTFNPAKPNTEAIRIKVGSVNDTLDYVATDNEIFAVEGLSKKLDEYGVSSNNWRSPQIFDLYGQKLKNFERIFHGRKKTHEIFSFDGNKLTSATRNSTDIRKILIQENLEVLIFSLANLNAKKWLSNPITNDKKKVFLTVKLQTDTDKTMTLKILRMASGKNNSEKKEYFYAHLIESNEYCLLDPLVPSLLAASVIDPAWSKKNLQENE